jgi:hypothetical protein
MTVQTTKYEKDIQVMCSLIYPDAFADPAVPQKVSLLRHGFVQSIIHMTELAAQQRRKNKAVKLKQPHTNDACRPSSPK